MRPPTPNYISQGSHGDTKAVDYSPWQNKDKTIWNPYVFAPEDLTFDSYQQRGSGKLDAGMCLRGRGVNGLHQFAHLEQTYFTGGAVKKGTKIAEMGYTGYTIPKGPAGRHLHYWVKTPKGAFVYPPTLYTEPFGGNPTPPPTPGMPPIGSRVQFSIPRTAFVAGTTTVKGTLPPDIRIVRGYDPKYPYRILVNSASVGNGVAVALYYTNGQVIPGWKVL